MKKVLTVIVAGVVIALGAITFAMAPTAAKKTKRDRRRDAGRSALVHTPLLH